MAQRRRVAVVGGGISGLATAYALGRGVPAPEVTVFEAAPRAGGKIRTVRVAGLDVDTGPDGLLVRTDAVRELLADLGLAAAARTPQIRRAYLWSRGRWSPGRLRPLPASSAFGVPQRLLPLLRHGVLSPAGALRAGADLVLPRRPTPGADPTIGELLRPRFGHQVVDRLIEPMVGGVHAGRVDRLSARSAVPELHALATRGRSVYRTMSRLDPPKPHGRELRAAAGVGGQVAPTGFVSFDGGLQRLVGALLERIGPQRVRTGVRVLAVDRTHDGYLLQLGGDGAPRQERFDAVVLATPTAVTAGLLRDLAPAAAAALDGVHYADVATVTVAVPVAAVRRRLDGTGFLVPAVDGRLLVGCSWLTSKWPQLGNDSVAVFRCLVGRGDDDRWTTMDDAALQAAVLAELDATVGLDGAPVQVHVQRWPGAIPQYEVGHGARLAAVEQALDALPGLAVTGAGYRGAGLASCITQAQATAAALLAADPAGHPPVEGDHR